jgi:hypothetical protein
MTIAVLAERPDTILVEMGLPYWQPPPGSCQAYLATYGASRANAQAAAELLGLTDLRHPVAGKWEPPDRKRGKSRSANIVVAELKSMAVPSL